MLTTTQVAVSLGVSLRRVQALIKAGRLRARRLGRDYFITPADMERVRSRPPGRPRKNPKKSRQSA